MIAQRGESGARYYLIHNGVICPDESVDFILARANAGRVATGRPHVVPAYDIVKHALATSGSFRIASINERLGLMPQALFDMDYVKSLFLFAYRQGRMGKEWKATYPGLADAVARPRH